MRRAPTGGQTVDFDPAIRGTIPGIDDIASLFNPSPAFNQLAAAVGILVALLAGLVPAFTATLSAAELTRSAAPAYRSRASEHDPSVRTLT